MVKMTSAGSSGVLEMTLGAIKRASIVKYCVVGFVNTKPTYMVRQMVHREEGREIVQSIGVLTHKAVLNTSEMTPSEGCKLPLRSHSLIHTISRQS